MQKMCLICLDEDASPEFTVLPTCRHDMHSECLRKWLDESQREGRAPSCPMCRAPLRPTRFVAGDVRPTALAVDLMALSAAIEGAAQDVAAQCSAVASEVPQLARQLSDAGSIVVNFIAEHHWATGCITAPLADPAIEQSRRRVLMLAVVLARAMRAVGLRVRLDVEGIPPILHETPDVLFTSDMARFEQFGGWRWGAFVSD